MQIEAVAWGVLALALLGASGFAQSHGDATRGRVLYESRCIGCHSLDAHRVGPAHRSVFGRQAGTAPDYEYSPALREAMLVWSEGNLDRWLANPEGLIPGQRMAYRVTSSQDRADLIAYLLAVGIDDGGP